MGEETGGCLGGVSKCEAGVSYRPLLKLEKQQDSSVEEGIRVAQPLHSPLWNGPSLNRRWAGRVSTIKVIRDNRTG